MNSPDSVIRLNELIVKLKFLSFKFEGVCFFKTVCLGVKLLVTLSFHTHFSETLYLQYEDH